MYYSEKIDKLSCSAESILNNSGQVSIYQLSEDNKTLIRIYVVDLSKEDTSKFKPSSKLKSSSKLLTDAFKKDPKIREFVEKAGYLWLTLVFDKIAENKFVLRMPYWLDTNKDYIKRYYYGYIESIECEV